VCHVHKLLIEADQVHFSDCHVRGYFVQKRCRIHLVKSLQCTFVIFDINRLDSEIKLTKSMKCDRLYILINSKFIINWNNLSSVKMLSIKISQIWQRRLHANQSISFIRNTDEYYSYINNVRQNVLPSIALSPYWLLPYTDNGWHWFRLWISSDNPTL